MTAALYLDTSAILRTLLESDRDPRLGERIPTSGTLIISRLARVEAARALHRLRIMGRASEEQLADAARALDTLWARCDVWELTPAVCALAADVAPIKPLHTLDALHLATYLLARRHLGHLELVTADERLAEAARGA